MIPKVERRQGWPYLTGSCAVCYTSFNEGFYKASRSHLSGGLMPIARVVFLAFLGVVSLLVLWFLWESFGSGGPLIVLLLLVLVAFWLLAAYNDLQAAYHQAKLVEGNLDAHLKARFESLPRLEEYLQSLTNFSREVLERLADARKSYGIAQNIQERWASYVDVRSILENYPNLNPQREIHERLMTILRDWTGDVNILAARMDYNKAANTYNMKISMFPGNILAAIFGFEAIPLLEASPEERGMPASQIRLDRG